MEYMYKWIDIADINMFGCIMTLCSTILLGLQGEYNTVIDVEFQWSSVIFIDFKHRQQVLLTKFFKTHDTILYYCTVTVQK